ncbi:hypothetical protein B0H67DRAFT_644642 [Lasiosphaeris hirsuta]|uniref:Uncharacterized protein n=1 Tax=Lasiosphaeris hirsuta TaxID=260670 RepID=A0AA40DVL1_9PEZI|nr:hypothetical protein B0H67DRAFT_644642 [Lasiosphaeris hirsuta]
MLKAVGAVDQPLPPAPVNRRSFSQQLLIVALFTYAQIPSLRVPGAMPSPCRPPAPTAPSGKEKYMPFVSSPLNPDKHTASFDSPAAPGKKSYRKKGSKTSTGPASPTQYLLRRKAKEACKKHKRHKEVESDPTAPQYEADAKDSEDITNALPLHPRPRPAYQPKSEYPYTTADNEDNNDSHVVNIELASTPVTSQHRVNPDEIDSVPIVKRLPNEYDPLFSLLITLVGVCVIVRTIDRTCAID